MRRPPDIPRSPGVYALIHVGQMVAYVGKCTDLAHRAAVLAWSLKNNKLPIKNLPKAPSEEWSFLAYPHNVVGELDDVVAKVMTLMAKGNVRVVNPNKRARSRDLITYKGKTCSLAEHAEDAGVNYATAYRRYRAGKPMEEVLGS